MKGKLKITETIEIREQPGQYHILGTPLSGAASLCGWVDVPHKIHDSTSHPVNCEMCLDTLKYCKKL